MTSFNDCDLPQQLPNLAGSTNERGSNANCGKGVHAGRFKGVGGAMSEPLRAPFPYFGGKSRVAHEVWDRFGDPENFVEPFAGSLAVLLARPHEPRVETVNDADAMVANAWRAIQAAPELVARFCDQPVNEADLHAVHRWLVFGDEHRSEERRFIVAALEQILRGEQAEAEAVLRAALEHDRPLGPAFRERMRRDAEYFDGEIAGRWIWGLCAWIGSGWCTTDPDEFHENEGKRPEIGAGGQGPGRPRAGKGVHAARMRVERDAGARPDMSSAGRGVHAPGQRGLHEKLPRVGAGGGGSGADHGIGVHGLGMRELAQQLPNLRGGAHGDVGAPGFGSGVHARASRALPQKRPILGAGHGTQGDYPYHGQGVHALGQRTALYETFERLAGRLRYVRVACGDWSRVVTDSVTWRHGSTAIFLDPPYSEAVRQAGLYAVDSGEVAAEVLRWCREHGADARLRIALCGYDNENHGGELEKLGWSVLAWQAKGGYGGQRKRAKKGETKNTNAARERIWFSPGCLHEARPTQRTFDFGATAPGAT